MKRKLLETKSRLSPEEVIIGDLKQEILRLREENDELHDKNTDLSFVMADLNTKLKDVENERNSLFTALKPLQLNPSENREHHKSAR